MITKKLKPNILYIITVIILSIFIVSIAPAVHADTDGKELKITNQPDKLVLYLGADLAGAEFELKLDSGIFPVPVKADKSGVLKMELGGSKTYTLTRLIPAVAASPSSPATTAVPTVNLATEQSIDTNQPNPIVSEFETDAKPITPEDIPDENEDETAIIEPTGNSIPVFTLVLFIIGLIAAVGGLIIMWAIKRRREYYNDDSEYEYDDEE